MADSTPAPAVTPPDRRADAVAERLPPTLSQRDLLIVAAGALVLIDVAFFVLGRMYYIDKLDGAIAMTDVADPEAAAATAAWAATRATFFWGFFTFSTFGVAAVTAAALWPRVVGHALAVLFGGLFLTSAGFIMFRSHMPVLVGVFQATIGALMLRLAYASYKKDRAAWAFLLSLAGVLAVAMLFGAPRIRAAMTVPRLWFVMLIPAVMAAVAVGLYRARKDYA